MRTHALRKAKPLLKSMTIYLALICFLGFAISSRLVTDASQEVVPVFSKLSAESNTDLIPKFNSFSGETWKQLLSSTVPGLGKISGLKPPKDWNPASLFLYLLTGEKINDPVYCLKTEVPVMSMMPMEMDNIDELKSDPITEPPKPSNNKPKAPKIDNKVTSDQPLVAFYCTHSSETYELTAGVTHLKGKSGAVMGVAEKIAKKIEEEYSIPTIFSDKIHDLVYNNSYIESEKTVKSLVAENKSLKMIFDIHRDSAVPKENTVTTIDGKKCAKILIIVGTEARAAHPKWRENLAFARKFAAKMDELYPGLSRGISVKQGRYNQQHHSSGLLLEVGSVNNTTEEAYNSANLLADIIVALLNEEK